ncbi:hypothetical protein ACFLWS_04855 [Chloroflexota bacterium]
MTSLQRWLYARWLDHLFVEVLLGYRVGKATSGVFVQQDISNCMCSVLEYVPQESVQPVEISPPS